MITIKEEDERFRIGQSTQPDAGRGLFALKDIEAGDFIVVKGVMVEKGSPADACTSYADAFKFAADYADSYTGHIIPMGYAAIVNHANDQKDQNVEIRHIMIADKRTCVYYFIKPVPAGQEVLGDYGEGWRGLDDWSRTVNGSADTSEEEEWVSFMGRGLYNLDRLKRPRGEDAADQ
jgi:hypothetical protein